MPFQAFLPPRWQVEGIGCAAARAWAQPSAGPGVPQQDQSPWSCAHAYPSPGSCSLRPFFSPKLIFFLNRFSCKTHQPPVKAVSGTACAMQPCVSPCPFLTPPLFCPQTANNLFFTMTQEGRGCPGDAGSKLGSFGVPECRAEDDFHLPREEMKEKRRDYIKAEPSQPHMPWP